MSVWVMTAAHVFMLPHRGWVAACGAVDGEARTGDRVVVEADGGPVGGVVEGIELHRPPSAPQSWFCLLIGGPAAKVIREGSRLLGDRG